jgi:glycosyltransferase involved in cell wall biosynthesis
MNLTYVTTFDAQDPNNPHNWAGTGYYIPESLKKNSIALQYIGSLQENPRLRAVGKLKRHYYDFSQRKSYLNALSPLVLKDYARQVSRSLDRIETDIVFAATITPIAYLNCDRPIVFWADATFKDLLDFYPQFTGLCDETIGHGHSMEKSALARCKLAIYSSEWAAQTAIDYYHADPSKVKVVPFGANMETNTTLAEIKESIAAKPCNKCKLLFLGIDWVRKGGDVALAVAQKLNDLGLETELTLVGSQPMTAEPLPKFVKMLGFINKSSAGKQQLSQIIAESHLLILPSLADCTPIVFCEANALGVPCISRKIGGIPTIIKDNINGKLFDRDSDPIEYCNYILHLFSDYNNYLDLALSAFQEYESRLNWRVAGKNVKELLMNLQ